MKAKQGRHCTYYVTVRSVRATIVSVEKQYVLDIVSVGLWPWVSSMKCACAVLSCVPCPALQ